MLVKMKIIRQVNGPWGIMPSCGLSTSLNHYSSCYRKLFLIFGSVRPSYHFFLMPHLAWVPGGSSSKEPTCQCRRLRFHPWVGKISWRRAWQPTPVVLPEEPVDRGTQQAIVHRVAKSWTQPKWLSTKPQLKGVKSVFISDSMMS